MFTFSVIFRLCSNFSTTEITENTEIFVLSVFSVISVVEIYRSVSQTCGIPKIHPLKVHKAPKRAMFTFSVIFRLCSNFSTTEITENTEIFVLSVFSVISVVEIYTSVSQTCGIPKIHPLKVHKAPKRAMFTFSVIFRLCSNFSTTEITENTEIFVLSVFSVISVVEIYTSVSQTCGIPKIHPLKVHKAPKRAMFFNCGIVNTFSLLSLPCWLSPTAKSIFKA